MDVDQDRLVDALSSALRYGGSALGDVPELLKRVLAEGVWRDFTTRRRQQVHHDRFADFVAAEPPAGLGSDVDLVKRIVAHDVEAVDLLDQALQNSTGVHNINARPKGTARGQALRRLRKDAPELHAEVIAGRLSAHAAAVQAGFRPRTFTVRADDPALAAATLRRNLTAEQLCTLAHLLLEG